MRALYFDLISGASGDMLLGALVDAGVPGGSLKELLQGLDLSEFELEIQPVDKNGFQAVKVNVLVREQPPERYLQEITEIIDHSRLPEEIKGRMTKIFQRIAAVEGKIHHLPPDQIHFHELGGTDTIIDIAGVLLALDYLKVERIYSSPPPLGRGFISGAHGQIPLPAPATLSLLEGIPVVGRDIEAELVTPTAAALLSEVVESYGPIPPLVLSKVGYGAGSRDLPVPNLLRVLIGDLADAGQASYQQLTLLETNLDDLNPEIYPYLTERLFEAGALDVCLIPIHMKKNRPGTQIQILAEIPDQNKMKSILFQETTTLGIRQSFVDRFALARTVQEVSTRYGTVRVKVAQIEGSSKVSPEYEDCARLARENKVPIRLLYQEVMSIVKDTDLEG
jgi:uncharacterized protein (TIGR00299 family) protein